MTPTNANLPTYEPPSTTRSSRPDLHRNDDREDFRFYASVLRKHVRTVVAIPVIVGVLVVTASLMRNREYSVRAAFIPTEPSSPSSAIGSLSGVAAQLGIPGLSSIAANTAALGPQFYGDLLSSTALLHTLVVSRFEAPTGENVGPAFTGTLVEYMRGDGATTADREIDAMNRFARNAVTVTVDRPTGVVRFQVRTTNRKLSELIARRMLDLVNDFNLRRRQSQAGNERAFASLRAAAALDTLHAAEAALAEFRATNIDFSRSPRLATRETELQRRVTLAQTIYITVAQRYELANLESVRNTPVITVLDAPEGLSEGLPRHTRAYAIGAFLLALVLSCSLALWRERNQQTIERLQT